MRTTGYGKILIYQVPQITGPKQPAFMCRLVPRKSIICLSLYWALLLSPMRPGITVFIYTSIWNSNRDKAKRWMINRGHVHIHELTLRYLCELWRRTSSSLARESRVVGPRASFCSGVRTLACCKTSSNSSFDLGSEVVTGGVITWSLEVRI